MVFDPENRKRHHKVVIRAETPENTGVCGLNFFFRPVYLAAHECDSSANHMVATALILPRKILQPLDIAIGEPDVDLPHGLIQDWWASWRAFSVVHNRYILRAIYNRKWEIMDANSGVRHFAALSMASYMLQRAPSCARTLA
jgi:hypothetical protein